MPFTISFLGCTISPVHCFLLKRRSKSFRVEILSDDLNIPYSRFVSPKPHSLDEVLASITAVV
jgi:hypothetical protein